MNQIDAVLFDWDGTLIESSELSFEAFKKTFHDFGIFLGIEHYERIYSPDWHSMYRALELPAQKWEEADQRWIYHYGQQVPLLAAGAQEALNGLAERFCLGVVTSGSRSRVLREMDFLDLARYFQTVISGDDVQLRKPHPEGILTAMKQICKQPQACCYVGDSPEDMEMGKRVGVFTIGIQSRYPGSNRLLSADPHIYIDSMSQLLPALKLWRKT